MELLARKPTLEFKYHDVTFLIKGSATAADKMDLALGGRQEGDKTIYNSAEYCRALVRLFVVGWKGVTFEGKEVPYAFETFCEHFPHVHGDNAFVKVAAFIVEHTDVKKEQKDLKNG